MASSKTTLVAESGSNDAFQNLLLRLSEAVSAGGDYRSIVQLFCQAAREFFGVSGSYFCELSSSDELVGTEADGVMAEEFRGRRLPLNAESSTVVNDVVRSRTTLYVNRIDPARFPMAQEFGTRSILSAPLIVSGDVIGAIVFVSVTDPDFFNEDLAAKATILATQMGSLLGAVRLTDRANNHAQELQALLEISSELSSARELDDFMRDFAQRAVKFLDYRRSFLALYDDGKFHARWSASLEGSQPGKGEIPDGLVTRRWLNKEVFWADNVSEVSGINAELVARFAVTQMLTVPLLGSDDKVLGAFGVLDRDDGGRISEEDVRRARALASQVAVVLEMKRNLDEAEQHRQRAEALTSLVLETSTLLRVPEFARCFVERAAGVMNAKAAALALQQDSKLTIAALHGAPAIDQNVLRRLGTALGEAIAQRSGLVTGAASELLGPALSASLEWADLTIARLQGRGGELIGVLCLANRHSTCSEDEQLLQAVVGHGAVALENARLFTRMDQANRHWVEIFDAISDFMVVHDEQHNVLRVNRAMADFIGVRPTELIGLSMSALLSSAGEVAPRSCPFCRTGRSSEEEFIQPVLDRTYLVSTSQIHGSENESLQTIHVLKDITDRREAERRYRELFDNIQEGLFFTSPEGRFIEVNDALVRMLGYEGRDDLLQVDISRQIYATSESRQELMDQMQQRGVVRNYPCTLRRRDGGSIQVLINAFAVRDAQGRVAQFRGLMLDITELTNFQAELQRERDFSSKILNNTQSLILVVDTAGLISYANRRWYEAGGYQQQQLVGHPLIELIAPSRRQAVSDALHATLAGQQVDNLEVPVMRADGRTGQFSINLSPMRDDQGHVSSIVVVMSDITDTAMLQAKLVHTEKLAAVGQLVSGVAHEVNNPLTAILGFADLLMENPEMPDSARKDLRVILQEAQRTKQIVQNLLSFARQMPPQRRALQLNHILTQTLQLRAYDFSSHGVEVVQHFHDNLPEVIGDSHQLQQVFLNIINNAYDAVRDTGRPARIEIMTSSTQGFAEAAVRDNGNGITHIDRIFDPFFTTKEVGKGTGLGLSICYGIVREHGGEIYCHNNQHGPGATFVVRLPAVSECASPGLSAGGEA